VVFGRSWPVVGLAQILVAVATAWLVYELGRRWVSHAAGIVAALLTTLHPYAIWHDVHVNREILDGLLAAAVVLCTLVLLERRTYAAAALLGAVLGVAILGNVRLTLLPAVLLGFLLWCWRADRRSLALAGVSVAATALVVLPWVVRNHEAVGCFAVTTDSRALWEANSPRTLETLRNGGWIDNVPLPPEFPPSAQDAGREYRRHGRIVRVDECRQMRFYRSEVLEFWREHPGEKAKLAAQASVMLWSPKVLPPDTKGDSAGWLVDLRTWVEPLYMLPLFLLAAFGFFRVSRRLAVLMALLLGYQWAMAMIFVGATRYRVPWDFVIALLAAAALLDLLARLRRRRGGPEAVA
jgi:4-amino-4-deoxy-L-arabinose transferase-like glycosyltransferase